MTELRRRMLEDMQLRGLAEHTRQSYMDAVRMLAEHYHRSPDQLGEEEIRKFFLYLIQERKLCQGTIRVYLYGIKFFYERTLKREWPVLHLIRGQASKRLPTVLSVEEVHRLLGLVKIPRNHMCLLTIYSCGLRLSEATHLKVTDIDSNRNVLWVRGGKGAKDRCIPLPRRTVELLRKYWLIGRPRPWLFLGNRGPSPISNEAIEVCWKKVVRKSDIMKHVCVHTLRHSYATHLLENGVDIRVIQGILGHRNPKSTVIYTHLTQKVMTTLYATVDNLMANL